MAGCRGRSPGHVALKVLSLVPARVAGADTIDGMGVLRHNGTGRMFTGSRAATMLGMCLRAATFGHVRQLDAVAPRVLIALSTWAPLIAGGDAVAYLDIDDTVRRTYGDATQCAG